MPERPIVPDLQAFVDELVISGEAAAAVALVGDGGAVLTVASAAVPVTARFDLASLTKPFVATLALDLHLRGRLPLETLVGHVWRRREALAGYALEGRRLEDLLRHRSGLASWAPLYALASDRRGALARLLSGELLEPAPGGVVYSDLGYVLWGFAAEEALGRPLAELLEQRLTAPLGLSSLGTGFLPGSAEAPVPSPMDTAKEVELAAARDLDVALQPPPPPGQPQDGNARFLGGVSGHAGLFATAEDVWRFGVEWLRASSGRRGRLLTPALARRALGGTDPWALGWARRSDDGSSGPALSPEAFGHVGFTGTSLWIDPPKERIAVLLAARTSPLGDFNRHRRAFHKIAFAP